MKGGQGFPRPRDHVELAVRVPPRIGIKIGRSLRRCTECTYSVMSRNVECPMSSPGSTSTPKASDTIVHSSTRWSESAPRAKKSSSDSRLESSRSTSLQSDAIRISVFDRSARGTVRSPPCACIAASLDSTIDASARRDGFPDAACGNSFIWMKRFGTCVAGTRVWRNPRRCRHVLQPSPGSRM